MKTSVSCETHIHFLSGKFQTYTEAEGAASTERNSGQLACLHSLPHYLEQTPDSASRIQNRNSHVQPGVLLTELQLAAAANASGLQSEPSKKAHRLSEDK